MSDLPLRLFLDRTSPLCVGGEGNLVWVIANALPESLASLRIEVKHNPNVSIPAETLHFPLPPATMGDLSQFADLSGSQASTLIFHVRIEAEGLSGRRYILNRPETVRLPNLPGKGGGGSFKLSVEGATLLDKADLTGFRKVDLELEDAAAILNTRFHPDADVSIKARNLTLGDSNMPHAGASAFSGKHIEPQSRRAEDLVEICGFQVEIIDPPAIDHGLSPLSLDQFVQAWPHRRDVQIGFVDERGYPRENEARVNDVYRLHIRPAGSGALTLIAQGSSGAYYLLAPKPEGARHVSGHVDHYWPGNLNPKAANAYVFMDAGEERVLTLVTPEPLLPPCNSEKITPDALAGLLQQALSQPGSSLGYTRLPINQQRAWHLN